MSTVNLSYLLPVIATGIIAGWLAGLVTRGRGFGLFGNMLVATAGAVAGIYLFDSFDIQLAKGFFDQFAAAFIGAFLTLVFIGWLRR